MRQNKLTRTAVSASLETLWTAGVSSMVSVASAVYVAGVSKALAPAVCISGSFYG
jgi:hypothetical protein